MAEFLCKVADGSGKVFLQVEPAESMTEARQKLADRGLFVYNVRPRAGVLGQFFRRSARSPVDGNDFLVFNQQFNTLIKAGIPILRARSDLAHRTRGRRTASARPRRGSPAGSRRNHSVGGLGATRRFSRKSLHSVRPCGRKERQALSGVARVLHYAYQRVTTGVPKKNLSPH